MYNCRMKQPLRSFIPITVLQHSQPVLLRPMPPAKLPALLKGVALGLFGSTAKKPTVTHIAEKTGGTSTFTHQNGTFTAKVMLCG